METTHISEVQSQPLSGGQQGNTPGKTQSVTVSSKKIISQKAKRLLLFIYAALSILFVSRFILALMGADQTTPFVNFVYQLSFPFMIPFANIFGRPLQAGLYRIEFDVLVGLLIYWLLFFGIVKLIDILFD